MTDAPDPAPDPDLDAIELNLLVARDGYPSLRRRIDPALALIPLVRRQAAEIERLKAGIRDHRDQRGDDRCWLDDQKLYDLLDDGQHAQTGLPPKDEFLESCNRFWCSRQAPGEPKTGSMTIAQLEAEIARLEAELADLKRRLAVPNWAPW